jgi:hypothetical protein
MASEANEAKKEEGLGQFFGGLIIGAMFTGLVFLAVVFYAKNEREHREEDGRLSGKLIDLQLEQGSIKSRSETHRLVISDLSERVEKLEKQHRCPCGEECRCEDCQCVTREECECGDPECDWPQKTPLSRRACPKFVPPPRGPRPSCERPSCQGPCCPAPQAPRLTPLAPGCPAPAPEV